MWTWLNLMAARIRALFRAGDDDRDFGLELESHLSMLTEDKIRSGMTAEEARRQARLELGGLAQLQQAHRDIRLFPFVDTLLQDARYGLSMLRRNPGFTIVAMLTLALGIGANAPVTQLILLILIQG
ncbi:MAG: hypothetical protein J2P21_18860 [Chloracidobacterium sp.]|nr:hypothetical protein [Chloracidobacterium sp.]